MIATVRGEVTQVEDNALIVEVSGVGIRVFAPAPLRSKLKVGETVLLYTHLIMRETDLSLYGFETVADRTLFATLLGVDGVGPKVALSVLSTLDLNTVQRAVANDESDLLATVPGIGKRTAQKIVLYLHDRLKPSGALQAAGSMSDTDSEVLAALTTLGYSVVEGQTALQSLPKNAPDDVEQRLRMALQYFRN